MKQKFALRDKVRVLGPGGHLFVGQTGQVVDLCEDGTLIVAVDTFVGTQCLVFSRDRVELLDTPKETMSEEKNFNLGDKVVCREKHPDCDSPNWVKDMDRIVGVVGTVVGLTPYIRVKYCKVYGEPSPIEWSLHRDWLDYALTPTQNKMTSPADTAQATAQATATATAKAKETFTTTWSLDITLTDGKVTAVNVHPPAPPEPQKPKFAEGDIVVCKIKPREMPKGYEWTNEMTLTLNIPGRVMYVSDCKSKMSKIVSVEFGGFKSRFAYPEECLEHETSEMAAAMKQVFARLDKEKNTVCIGRSSAQFI